MRTGLERRIRELEKKLGYGNMPNAVLISAWGSDPEDVREDKLARWRAGENIAGAPDDADRESFVIMIVGVSPKR